MKVVFGLGNPGTAYKNTLHNIGFWLVEKLATHFNCNWKREHSTSLTCSFQIENEDILLVKPKTYMNLSGKSASYILNKYQIAKSDFILISDDVNLPIGKIRFRSQGSSGGHNGIKSVIAALGTNEFPRLRIGIGSPDFDQELADFVLGNWTEEEFEKMQKVISMAEEAIIFALQEGIIKSMNKYNGMDII